MPVRAFGFLYVCVYDCILCCAVVMPVRAFGFLYKNERIF